MLKSVEGVYRDGRIELAERPAKVPRRSRVIVTFLEGEEPIDLSERGIDEAQASALRGRLATFAEEWDSPAMDAYDDYDNARAEL